MNQNPDLNLLLKLSKEFHHGLIQLVSVDLFVMVSNQLLSNQYLWEVFIKSSTKSSRFVDRRAVHDTQNIYIDIILGPCHSTSEPRKIWPTSSLSDQISPIGRNTISYFSALFRIVVIFCAGAEVMCAETVPVRMHTASQQRQGPEATLVWSQPEPGVKAEDWLLFVR